MKFSSAEKFMHNKNIAIDFLAVYKFYLRLITFKVHE